MATTGKNVQHLVVDSGGFIRNAPLKDLGEEIYTVNGVVEEIRDKATRERLQILPYELRLKEPSTECIHAVSEFAKKTGDYRTLSSVDLKVLGLLYQLHKQHIGLDGIRTEPVSKVTMVGSTVISSTGAVHKDSGSTSSGEPTPVQDDKLALTSEADKSESMLQEDKCAFTLTDKAKAVQSENSELNDPSESAKPAVSKALEESSTDKLTPESSDIKNICSELEQTSLSDNGKTKTKINCNGSVTLVEQFINEKQADDVKENDVTNDKHETTKNDDEIEDVDDDDESQEEDEEQEEDDGGDWITPQNYSEVKQTLSDQMNKCEHAEVQVACLTTDFAMQNVILQMGLHLISVDGMMIRRTTNYVLRCTACFKVTAEMKREFCHHCGNRTLRRVATSVDADGSVRYHISTRNKLNTRGLRYTLPTPKGGKHASNPILCEDQRPSQSQKASAKFRQKYEAMAEDYIAHTSPFAPIDVNSRSAIHRFTAGHKARGGGRKNPNENSKVYGRRK